MWQLPFDVALIENGKSREELWLRSSGKLWKTLGVE